MQQAIEKSTEKKGEKGLTDADWASIINDARFYDGTPQMLTQLTDHFKKVYGMRDKLSTNK